MPSKKKASIKENPQNNTITVKAEIPRIMNHKQLLAFLKIDGKDWEVKEVQYTKSEGYRKDRSVEWDVVNGKVKRGKVRDSGKLLIKPLFHITVLLRKKIEVIAARNEVQVYKSEAKKYSPIYKKIKHSRKGDFLYELAMPDLQLGRLVMAQEAGSDSNPDKYLERAQAAIEELLIVTTKYSVEKILFPIGNDFFNSNTSENMTAHGTPQRDDVRWQRTYRLAKRTMVGLIETMSQIAPVQIPIIKGNHDEERIFYFGDTIESWFNRNPNVSVDNRPIGRKYVSYGKVLLGLAHGYYEKIDKLDSLMAYEEPQLWAKSLYREWHLGDKHHKKDIVLKTHEYPNGVVVRILRSLADPSVWEYDKQFVGSLKAAEGFLWQKEQGLFAQFTSKGV